MQTVRKKRVNEAGASSLRVPRPSRSLRRGAIGKPGLVFLDASGKPAGNGPDRRGIEDVQKHGVRHQPRHAAIAIDERMHPEQAKVGRGGGDNPIGRARIAVNVLEALKEAGLVT